MSSMREKTTLDIVISRKSQLTILTCWNCTITWSFRRWCWVGRGQSQYRRRTAWEKVNTKLAPMREIASPAKNESGFKPTYSCICRCTISIWVSKVRIIVKVQYTNHSNKNPPTTLRILHPRWIQSDSQPMDTNGSKEKFKTSATSRPKGKKTWRLNYITAILWASTLHFDPERKSNRWSTVMDSKE